MMRHKIADDTETKCRAREIQLLLNIVEPDPEYQPFILTDGASILDAVRTDADVIGARLATYFHGSFSFDLHLPMWKLVDDIKACYPMWPDNW